VYENAPSGTIGEFGLNTLTNRVFEPVAARDFMTYCTPTWVSPYTYVGLMGTITNTFSSAIRPSQRQETLREYLWLNFRFHELGRVELLSSFHLTGAPPDVVPGPAISLRCDLLGSDGEILHTHRCHVADPHQDPNGPELLVREFIPWYPETRAIAFRRDQEVLYRHELEGPPPEVSIAVPAGLLERRGTMRLEWKPVRKSAPVKYLVRFSHDGGATWRTLAADLGDPWAAIELDLLPGGEDCRFQIAASGGIRTTVSESAPFALPLKAVEAYLLEPTPDAVFLEGESIVFRGGGFSPNYETTPFEDVLWSSRTDGQIGVGPECVVSTLTAGRHRITVSMPDGLGGESTAGVTIDVRTNSE
jgi:hypothetical protein